MNTKKKNCEIVIFNNNRNRFFIINALNNNRIRIITYRNRFGCPVIFSISFFNKNDRIDFNGDFPKVVNKNDNLIINNSALFQSILRYNQWRRLTNNAISNEWELSNNVVYN